MEVVEVGAVGVMMKIGGKADDGGEGWGSEDDAAPSPFGGVADCGERGAWSISAHGFAGSGLDSRVGFWWGGW